MRFRRSLAILAASILLLTFCSCGSSSTSATNDSSAGSRSKYSDAPLADDEIGIGYHDDEYGFHIVNRFEFSHPQDYQSKHVAHSYQSLWKDSQKEAYDKILEACYCFSDEKDEDGYHYHMRPLTLEGTDFTDKEMEATIIAALDDHPEIFWMDSKFGYDIDKTSDTTTVSLHSLYTADDVLKMMKELDDALTAFYAGVPKDLSEYEREVYVYKYIIDHCEYDDNISGNEEYENTHPSLFNIYGMLVDQKAVCEGYAYAFDYLCSELGIDAACVCGTCENNKESGADDELHLWNAVMLDDQWYMADVTWDDLDEDEDVKDVFVYLNVTQKVMELDHTLDKTYEQLTDDEYKQLDCYVCNFVPPECTATEYCYYLRESVHLSEPDADTLSEGIIRAAEKKASALMVYVDSDSYTLEQMAKALFEGDQPYYEAMEKADGASEDSTLDVNAAAVYYYYDDRNLIVFEMPYNN